MAHALAFVGVIGQKRPGGFDERLPRLTIRLSIY
jgi:hypothetical protein